MQRQGNQALSDHNAEADYKIKTETNNVSS